MADARRIYVYKDWDGTAPERIELPYTRQKCRVKLFAAPPS